ncbi:AraC family transcriptional regulator [Aquibacillus albus]|uniref:AraC-like DNA-binding protein/mannose-6-phosphate isomerase-like protein (Cupin superfamily) n=1 Tax=Aquibacillus albus TaxID=1168171 RepID=A0ABS2N526_9BACI|nr:AraC family transcriptional regulator [Aquibacillus albus]MBM7573249.1 AraC-like DNA-binding protein/mannose-6-phosphate isomerase-like protein (cupin superfamily) [Aquibacillus albus]
MPEDLFQELIQETDEETAILQRNNQVKKDIYTDKTDFIIESEKFLSKEKMIMVRKHTRFVDFPKHKHDYIEINYVYNGRLEQKVGDEDIVLKKGELLLLNQYIEHEIKACQREDIIINFIIQPQFFDYIFSYLTADNIENNIGDFLINSLFNHTQSGQFLYFAVSEVKSIQELIHKIIKEIMKPSLLSESTIKLYMGLLMIELIKHSDKIEKQNESFMQYQLIMESLKYIEEHYKEASLYELADKLNQPHYRLSKDIKKVTNKTFKELLQEKRLQEAKELLKNTDIPISTVVEQVGYDNISYFYRIFKNKYGQTPRKFREKLMNHS